jgi:hypothetical protein
MYRNLPYIVIGILVLFVLIHSYMSVRFGYDWIGTQTRKVIHGVYKRSNSVHELYPIPPVPFMDRFSEFTKIPKMKESGQAPGSAYY